MESQHPVYWFGPWRIEPELNQLRDRDVIRKLVPKAMDVLVCLLDHPGEVLSPAQLVELAWPGRIVEDSSVHQRISQIRQALATTDSLPELIENIPRCGYRTTAMVTLESEEGRKVNSTRDDHR